MLAMIVEEFRPTPVEKLSRVRSYSPEEGALIYVCANQQLGQWLTEAINRHRFRESLC
jgi:hypothetical protein